MYKLDNSYFVSLLVCVFFVICELFDFSIYIYYTSKFLTCAFLHVRYGYTLQIRSH